MNVATILAILDDHGFADTAQDRKLEAINETYWEVCGMEPWPFLQKRIVLTFNGTDAFPSNWPTDFSAALKMKDAVSGLRMLHYRLDDFEEDYGQDIAKTGSPRLYYFEKDKAHFWPIPPAGTTIRMPYLIWPTELTAASAETDIVIPKRYHRGLLVNGAIQRLYMQDEDFDAAAAFEHLYDKAFERMRGDVHTVQFDSPDFVHAVDPDDFDYDW